MMFFILIAEWCKEVTIRCSLFMTNCVFLGGEGEVVMLFALIAGLLSAVR